MARAARLKLFRTPMGFFDAVVAVPSQAAALKAWGVTSNLFAEGLAAEVKDDAELLAEASARPGEIVRKTRGEPAAVLAQATPSRPPKPAPTPKAAARPTKVAPKPSQPAPPPRPAPDRSKLDAAERALAEAEADLESHLKAIADERAELDAQEKHTRREGKLEIAARREAVEVERAKFAAAS